MTLQQLLTDNPILVKHVRSRLRPQQLIPAVAATALLCAMIVWIGFAADGIKNGVAFNALVLLQIAILFLAGVTQVSNSVATSREAGVLDFHRISPVPPAVQALGFLLGGPIREWVLFFCTLPFALVIAAVGWPGPVGVLDVYTGFFVLALLYHLAALLGGLAASRARNAGGGILALVLVLQMVGVPPLTYFTLWPIFVEALDRSRNTKLLFLSSHVPALALCLIHQVPVIVFLAIAAVRRMRQDRAFLWSKPLAVLFHAVMGVVIVGDAISLSGAEFFNTKIPSEVAWMVSVYALAGAGLLLTLAVTPGAGDFGNGIRRARKQGRARPPLWDDLASNQAPALGFCAVLLAATALATSAALPAMLAAVGAVFVILSFAGAKQAFDLLYRRNANGYFMLFLFLLWFLPLMAAGAASISRVPAAVTAVLAAPSPLAGIALMGSARADPNGFPGAAVFLGSGVVLTAIFWQLRFQAERRAREAAARTVPAGSPPPPPPLLVSREGSG